MKCFTAGCTPQSLSSQFPQKSNSSVIEKLKASIRAKVAHPFRVIKCQFGYRKTRYKGLAKNTAQITTLFALSNLWMARRLFLGQQLRTQG